MTVLYLVRHAKAGNRKDWTADDRLRPLSEEGWRQAEGLVGLLDNPPPARLLSSPSVRCIQTLEPLGEKLGLRIEIADELAEGTPAAAAIDLMLAVATEPAALCTHGDVVISAIRKLRDGGMKVRGPVEFKKGSTWVLEARDGHVTRGRYLPPP